MKILVDADSCPKPARELVLKRAVKLNMKLIFAANRAVPVYGGAVMEICPKSENAADDRIVQLSQPGDLVVTRDIPLAKRLVERNVLVLEDRGRVINRNNVNELLSLRNFAVGLADNGLDIERSSGYGKRELKTFADNLERILSRYNQAPVSG
jgi:uncharacterized protein YaiI (UPF0178 family)